VYAATGAQTYTCTGTTVGTTTTYAWAGSPAASLYDQTCTLAGTHYAGPHWKSNDGSIVKGTLVRSAASVTANSIPQLLLSAANDPQDPGVAGILTPVTAVQRLSTVAGIAPTTACTATNVGETFAAPYSATYYFYSGTDIIPVP